MLQMVVIVHLNACSTGVLLIHLYNMHKHLYTKRSVITACIPTSRLIDANAAA